MEENKTNIPETEEEAACTAETEAAEKVAEELEENTEEKPCKGEKKKLKKAEAEIAELKKQLDAKNAEAAELNDRYMRLFAEYDNFRKRTAKELEGKAADAACDTLAAILPVLDNLERAAQYNTEDTAATNMGKGLELTLKSFIDTLAKLGVHEIEAEGKTFDPNLHNAVMHVEDENAEDSQVVEVFMKGYAKGDKVLRHSMVKVAN